jgi:hypothetical protein
MEVKKNPGVRSFVVILLTLAVSGLLHALAIWFLPIEGKGEDQETVNEIKLENYLFGVEATAKPVVVGTSLSAKSESNQFVNLSMGGASATTSLSILAKLESPPSLVLLEANNLFNPCDDLLVERFEGSLQTAIPLLQTRHRPLSLLLGAVSQLTGEGKSSAMPKPPMTQPGVSPEVRELRVGHNRKNYQSALSDDEIRSALSLLGDRLKKLEEKGSRVVLFETPIDEELKSLPRYLSWKEALREAFPKQTYVDIEVAEDETSDGIHLLPRGVFQLTLALEKLVEKFSPKTTADLPEVGTSQKKKHLAHH